MSDAAARPGSIAGIFGARTECGHDDAAQKITLVESVPPSTWCGHCFEHLRDLVESYHRHELTNAEVYAALTASVGLSPAQAQQFIHDLEESDGSDH